MGEVQRELEVEVEVEVRCGGCGCGGGMVEVDGGGQTTSRLDRYISSILRRTTRENLNWSVSFLSLSIGTIPLGATFGNTTFLGDLHSASVFSVCLSRSSTWLYCITYCLFAEMPSSLSPCRCSCWINLCWDSRLGNCYHLFRSFDWIPCYFVACISIDSQMPSAV